MSHFLLDGPVADVPIACPYRLGGNIWYAVKLESKRKGPDGGKREHYLHRARDLQPSLQHGANEKRVVENSGIDRDRLRQRRFRSLTVGQE